MHECSQWSPRAFVRSWFRVSVEVLRRTCTHLLLRTTGRKKKNSAKPERPSLYTSREMSTAELRSDSCRQQYCLSHCFFSFVLFRACVFMLFVMASLQSFSWGRAGHAKISWRGGSWTGTSTSRDCWRCSRPRARQRYERVQSTLICRSRFVSSKCPGRGGSWIVLTLFSVVGAPPVLKSYVVSSLQHLSYILCASSMECIRQSAVLRGSHARQYWTALITTKCFKMAVLRRYFLLHFDIA